MRSVPTFLHARSSAFWHSRTRNTFAVQWFFGAFAAHPLKQRARIGNEWHSAQLPILRASLGVATHNNLADFKIEVALLKRVRFALPHSRDRQAQRTVRACTRIATVTRAHLVIQR